MKPEASCSSTNDVDAEIRRSQLLGSEYYTLTYQPHDGDADGKFRRVRVILRDRNLKVITKTGYFAPAKGEQVDPRHQMMVDFRTPPGRMYRSPHWM